MAAAGPRGASSQPPAGAPSAGPAGQLALSFTAAFPASAQNAALNLSAALQTNAAAVLRPVALKHSAISISGVPAPQKHVRYYLSPEAPSNSFRIVESVGRGSGES